jgi:predicted ATPase
MECANTLACRFTYRFNGKLLPVKLSADLSSSHKRPLATLPKFLAAQRLRQLNRTERGFVMHAIFGFGPCSAAFFPRSFGLDRFVVISGCSGGGKSALLAELGLRGHPIVEEPGRRIVKEELRGGGSALPWVDEVAFARRAIAMALADRATASRIDGWVFFDRGLVDAAAGLQHLTGEQVLAAFGQCHRYHWRVFLAPPWHEIYATDPARRHGFDVAVAEYSRLFEAYPLLGYEVFVLPKMAVMDRADFVLCMLAEDP